MKDNVDYLLKKALIPYIDPGDNLNSKIYEANRSGKVVKMRHRSRMIKTAVMAVCILCAGTVSVYAAINKLGISDYFHMREMNYPEQAVEKLTEENSGQQPVGDSLVEFGIREVMADDNNMVIQIEAVPKKPEQYILIDAGEFDTITDDVKKQPLYIDITGNSEHGYSGDFFSESDGSLVYMLFYDEGTYSEGETLKFNAGYSSEVPAKSGFTNFELEYQITSLTKAEKIIYEPQEDVAWLKNVLNAQINEVCVYKSEASVKVTIDTLYEQTSGVREEGFDVWYKIINGDGNELVSIIGGTGEYIGDGIYRMRDVYEYTELSDTLTIVAFNPLDNSEYGRFTVKRRSN